MQSLRRKRRGRNHFVILTFSVLEPVRYRGVALLRWLPIAEHLSPLSNYARSWEIAAGKPATDDLPAEIFLGKVFRIYVGFRANDGNGKFSREHTSYRKAPFKGKPDFLRIHEILALADSRIAHRTLDIGHGTRTKTKTIAVVVGGGAAQHQQEQEQQYQQQSVSARLKGTRGERDTTPGKAGNRSDSSPSLDGRGITVDQVLKIFPGSRIVGSKNAGR